MYEYITDPVEVDADAMQQGAYAYIQSRWPDWRPADSNLETWQIAALVDIVSQSAEVASDVPPEIFRYFGTQLAGVGYNDATPATVDSTWSVDVDPTNDRTIPAGSIVSLPGKDDDPVYFESILDINVPATMASVTVPLSAVIEGEDGSGLGAAGVIASLVDAPSWVTQAVVDESTSGGADAEQTDSYLDRLSERLVLQPRPVLATDFAVLARLILEENGIQARVLAVDNFNPTDGTTNNERMVTVTAVDLLTGANIPGPMLTLLDDTLEASRETNFVVNTVNPVRTSIDVNVTVAAADGADPADAAAEAVQAIKDYFATWGLPSSRQDWKALSTVRHQELSTVVNNVASVDHWTVLTMRVSGGSFATTDITLSSGSPIAVADAGTITGSHT